MSVIVKTDHYIYEPTFCPDTDTYIDVCPYKKYERNCKIFNCNCKAGTILSGRANFYAHIKSDCHKTYVQQYALFKKELTEEQGKNKQLTYENQMLIRKVNKVDQDHKVLREKYEKLVEQNKKFHGKQEKLLNKYKKILEEITVD